MNELKQKILDLCNNSKLPLECIIYVVKDIWRDAEATLQEAEKQLAAQQKKEGDKEE